MKWNKFFLLRCWCHFVAHGKHRHFGDSMSVHNVHQALAGSQRRTWQNRWLEALSGALSGLVVAAAVAALTAGAVCKTTWNCERSLRKNLLVHSFALEMEASMDDLASLHGDVIFTVWTNLPGCHRNFWLGLLTIKVWLGECRRTKIMSWSDVEKIRRNKKHV